MKKEKVEVTVGAKSIEENINEPTLVQAKVKSKEIKSRRLIKKFELNWTLSIIAFFVLVCLITFLPLSHLLKVLSLLLGTFVIEDYFHFIKYVRTKLQ